MKTIMVKTKPFLHNPDLQLARFEMGAETLNNTIVQDETKALSLNGELGLAFGARGASGKNAAAAHYESSHIVIHLTKKQGAGSLAHEWWHGLDNYFARQDEGKR